jgi:cell wall assembly regulator SMI1
MSVESAWGRIVAALERNDPDSARLLRPPVGTEALSAAEAAFPRAWPEDLRRWYGLHDGAEHPGVWAVPDWMLLSLNEVVASARSYAKIYADFEPEGADPEVEEAGTTAFAFIASFVPIGEDGAASTLFVDTRPGPNFGCVTGFMREDTDTYGIEWASVTAMLEDAAAALEAEPSVDTATVSASCAERWQPIVARFKAVLDDRYRPTEEQVDYDGFSWLQGAFDMLYVRVHDLVGKWAAPQRWTIDSVAGVRAWTPILVEGLQTYRGPNGPILEVFAELADIAADVLPLIESDQ